jgi:hypothetical protein
MKFTLLNKCIYNGSGSCGTSCRSMCNVIKISNKKEVDHAPHVIKIPTIYYTYHIKSVKMTMVILT